MSLIEFCYLHVSCIIYDHFNRYSTNAGIIFYIDVYIIRGGEWFFKNSGSRKILVEFHGSHSLVFWVVMCGSQSRFLYEGISESQNTLNSLSCYLKSQNFSGSQRKNASLPVSHLPFATPIIAQPIVIIVCCFQIWDFSFRIWFDKTYPYLCVPACIILYVLIIIVSDQSILKQQACNIVYSRQCILTTLHTNHKIENR